MAGSLRSEVRRASEKSLLELHHETLLANGVKVLFFRDLAQDFRRGIGQSLTIAIAALGMLEFSSERAAQLAKSSGVNPDPD